MRMRAIGLIVLLNMGASAFLVAACSSSPPGSTVVAGSGLATSCSTNDDCIGAYFGDVCGLCTTDVPNAAIASSAETAYQNALHAAESHCPPAMAAGSCVADETITTCAMGICTLTTCAGTPASAHACASTNDAGTYGVDAATSDGGSTVVTGSGLATSCSTSEDCVGAYFGDVCGFCTTDEPNAAIASGAQAAYQSALNAAESHCPPNMGAGFCLEDNTITTCAMGTCTLSTCPGPAASAHACASTNDAGTNGSDAATSDGGSTVVTGSGLATSCSTSEDCVGAYFGDVCGFCTTDVPNAAIASGSEATYQSALNAAESHCPPRTFNGSCVADETITTCAMGTCTLTACPGPAASAHACTSTNDAGVNGSDAALSDAATSDAH